MITENTTVKELCEILERVNEKEDSTMCHMNLYDDMSGEFLLNDRVLCHIDRTDTYLQENVTLLPNIKSMSESELNDHIDFILTDDKAKEILIKKLFTK